MKTLMRIIAVVGFWVDQLKQFKEIVTRDGRRKMGNWEKEGKIKDLKL